jgi:hypothetical protein
MNRSDDFIPVELSSMFGVTPWGEYDVATRMEELRAFANAGVVPALYDALRLLANNPERTPKWVIELTLEVVADRLKHGTKLVTGTNDRKLYQRQIKSYYRWRCVYKYVLKDLSIEESAILAQNELANTFAAADENTIKKAYYSIQRELKDPKRASLYYSAMPDYSAMPETRELTGTSLVPDSAGGPA